MLLNILLKKLKKGKKTKTYETKDVYPYYMDSFNMFSEKKSPNEDDFYSILNNEHLFYLKEICRVLIG